MANARPTVLVALAAAALVLTACGDDEPEKSDAAASDTAAADGVEGAEAVVRAFYDDFGAGDYDAACERWTEEYAATLVSEWNEDNDAKRVRDCPEVLAQFAEVFDVLGDPAELLEVSDASGTLVADTTAHVEVTLASGEDETDTFELTLTDDGWLISGEVLADTSPSPTTTSSDE